MDAQAHVRVNVAFLSIPLEQLRPSTTKGQTQRRKHFDKVKLAELAESIASRGVVQPIVVRRDYSLEDGEHYEIVAGERRFLASQLAERDTIPAVVLELTDEEVIEVQLIENLQREDVHPMQEADGYHALIETHGHSVDELPGKIGKSRSYVYARLKLLNLCDEARTAFYKGDIDPSRALLIARIPGEAEQQRALKKITEKGWRGDGPRMSYREAQRYVHDTFMLKLSTAPFSRDDATLVPSAGACGPCPMRTGNATDLFDDVKSADVCTNPSCFKAKTAAHAKRELEKASVDGAEVIRGAKAKRILPDARYTVGSSSRDPLRNGYARPRDKCPDDPKQRTYAELAGKDAPTVLLQHPDSGKVEKVIHLEDVADRLKEKGISYKVPKDAAEAREQDTTRTEQKRKQEVEARTAIFRAIMEAAPKKLDRDGLICIITGFWRNLYPQDDDYAVLGWGQPKGNRAKWEADQLVSLSEAELSKLALGVTVLEDVSSDWGAAARLEHLAKHLGVDTKKIRSELAPKAEPKPEKTAKAGKKKVKR